MGPGGSTYELEVDLIDDGAGNTKLKVWYYIDGGAAGTLTSSALGSGTIQVEIVIQRATNDSSGDGIVTLYIDQAQDAQDTGIDNYDDFGQWLLGTNTMSYDQSESGTVTGIWYMDNVTFRDDDTPIFATNTFRFLGFDADTGTLMVSGLKDEATLKLFDYDLSTLTENGTASFGSATDSELDAKTRGIFPVTKPLEDDTWYLYGRDGNNVQVQYNNRNGTLGWTDLGPGTATWGTAKYAVTLLTAPMVSDDVIVAFADADVYRTRYGTETWVKMGTAPTGLRAGARHPTKFNELLLAGTVGGTMHYSPNFGASFTDASHDIAAGSVSHTIEHRIEAGADDGHVDQTASTFNDNHASGVIMGNATIFGPREAWYRWPDVAIPAGASVSNAYIEFVATSTQSGTVNLVIYGEDADDPAAPSDVADYNSRTRTGGSVLWTPAAWTSGQSYQTDDISTIIQEIVNRGGWAFSQAMQLFVEFVSGSNQSRIAESHENSASEAALLHVEYAADAGLINAIEVSL